MSDYEFEQLALKRQIESQKEKIKTDLILYLKQKGTFSEAQAIAIVEVLKYGEFIK